MTSHYNLSRNTPGDLQRDTDTTGTLTITAKLPVVPIVICMLVTSPGGPQRQTCLMLSAALVCLTSLMWNSSRTLLMVNPKGSAQWPWDLRRVWVSSWNDYPRWNSMAGSPWWLTPPGMSSISLRLRTRYDLAPDVPIDEFWISDAWYLGFPVPFIHSLFIVL